MKKKKKVKHHLQIPVSSAFIRYQGFSSLKKPVSSDIRSVHLTDTMQFPSVISRTNIVLSSFMCHHQID